MCAKGERTVSFFFKQEGHAQTSARFHAAGIGPHQHVPQSASLIALQVGRLLGGEEGVVPRQTDMPKVIALSVRKPKPRAFMFGLVSNGERNKVVVSFG